MTESDLVDGIIAVKRQWKASGEGTPSGTGGEGGRGDLTGTLHTPPVPSDRTAELYALLHQRIREQP